MTQEEFVTAIGKALGEDFKIEPLPAVAGKAAEPTTAWGLRIEWVPEQRVVYSAAYPPTRDLDTAAKYAAALIMAEFA